MRQRGVTDQVAFQAISGRMNELHFERMQLAFGRGEFGYPHKKMGYLWSDVRRQ
ncbi:hypothetical protein KEH51_13515 [[Brevibacterium] frigoritolerans]|uniref:Uncharacterized protein n=1 Tax=Peribacillus frigoritolerans TaxID=450367 RepID=A0A941FHR2_9BACI|nr:hypothetical protein [Peribacillus frigoritolerans]